jgi:hypothetical protein
MRTTLVAVVRPCEEGGVGSAENKTAAYGLFRMEVRLDEVVTSLNSAGFESEDICVFLPPAHPIVEGVRNMKAAASEFEMEAGPERMVFVAFHIRRSGDSRPRLFCGIARVPASADPHKSPA